MCINTPHHNHLTTPQHETLTTMTAPCSATSSASIIDDCADEIRAMSEREADYQVPDYINCPVPGQAVNEHVRQQMCEWIYQILAHCDFDKETASIAMNILDRFLGVSPWALKDMSGFQLAAVTALYTSIKIHESQAIAVESMVVLSRDVYTEEQIEGVERMMLHATKWQLNPPTATAFGWRMAKMISSMDEARFPFSTLLDLINMQLEAAVRDFDTSTKRQSVVAIGAVMNALEGMGMTSALEQKQVMANLCSLLNNNINTDHNEMNEIRQRLHKTFGEATPSTADSDMADTTDDYNLDAVSVTEVQEASTQLIRPTSPSSVSAMHVASPQQQKLSQHPSHLHPCSYTQ